MKEKELESILYREKSKIEARQIFSKQIETLIDMVNFGSNLIVRAYDSSKKGREDAIVIGVLLKHVLSMVDAIQTLVSNGITNPAFLQLRSAFKASLFIDWILKSDSKKKADYYYVSNLRGIKLWTLRYLHGTKENINYSQYMAEIKDYLEPQVLTLEQEADAKAQVTDIDRVLNQEGFKEINSELEKKIFKKTGIDISWYQLLGIGSIMKIAQELNRLTEYSLYYSRGSEFMHIASYRDHIQFKKSRVLFKPIRHLDDMNSILQGAMSVCFTSFISIINHYRYGERKNLGLKYKNDWGEVFQNIPIITSKADNS
jgi:hypothetical protein